MAGTDRTRRNDAEMHGSGSGSDSGSGSGSGFGSGPAIILVEPQLAENIGAAARAMLNCGLTDMRLVRPRDGWPNPRAEAMAAGAAMVLEGVRIFATVQAATAELDLVLASTARQRDMAKSVLTPRLAADRLAAHARAGGKSGILFGPERAGLVNDDVVLADAVINVPLNPAFSSLNLAQAVLLVGYEWRQAQTAGGAGAGESAGEGAGERDAAQGALEAWGALDAATVAEREYFFRRLEDELYAAGFLFPDTLAPTIKRNLRALFTRARLTDQEVRTLHGVLSALTNPRGAGRRSSSE